MTASAFDTLGYFEKLKAAGVPEQQAKIHADTMRELIEDKLLTKKDLVDAKKDLQIMIAELKHDLLKWIIGLAFAQTALVVTLLRIIK
jgi:hypothetical protein